MNQKKTSSLDYRLAKISSLRSALRELRELPDAESKIAAIQALKQEREKDFERKISGHDIILGTTPKEEVLVPEGTRVTIPSNRLNGNLSIMARIRTGKTFLLALILIQLKKLGLKWILFEKKKSLRSLISLAEAIVVTPSDLKHNAFLPPKGVPFRIHLSKICSIFAWTQVLLNVSEHELFGIVLGSLEEFQKEHPGKYPDIFLVRIMLGEAIKKHGYKEQRITNLIVGLMDRTNAICAYLADVYDDILGVDICDLSEKANLIVDCSGLPSAMVSFFCFEILVRLSLYRLWNGLTERNAPLLWVAMDEFEDMIGQINVQGNSLLIDHWRTDRESNLGKGTVTHTADFHQRYDGQAITNTIASNTFFTIVGPMGSMTELEKVGRRLQFDGHHYDWLSSGEERRFVLASPEHPPVCFNADELDLPETFDETDHAKRKKGLLSVYPRELVPAYRKGFALSEVFAKDFKISKTMEEVRNEAALHGKQDALTFLKAVKENPLSSYLIIRSAFKSSETAQRAKSLCLENGWLEEAALPVGKSRPSLVFHVTKSGREKLKSEGIALDGVSLHPFKHHTFVAYYANLLVERLRGMGLKVKTDQGDGLDIVVSDDSDLAGVEFNYKVPPARELQVVEQAIERGVPKAIVVVVNFEETKKGSFKMSNTSGKIKAFERELQTRFEHINHLVSLKTLGEIQKWNPLI
ncbi:MAG: hypothetical protein WBD36_03875 [Bacteroidota bacterium]